KMTSAPVTEISLKKERLFGTLTSSVEWSLFPTLRATKPEIILKIPVGCPIKKDLSPVTSQTNFRIIHGIKDQYNADVTAPKMTRGIPERPPSTPAATKINGNHQSI